MCQMSVKIWCPQNGKLSTATAKENYFFFGGGGGGFCIFGTCPLIFKPGNMLTLTVEFVVFVLLIVN